MSAAYASPSFLPMLLRPKGSDRFSQPRVTISSLPQIHFGFHSFDFKGWRSQRHCHQLSIRWQRLHEKGWCTAMLMLVVSHCQCDLPSTSSRPATYAKSSRMRALFDHVAGTTATVLDRSTDTLYLAKAREMLWRTRWLSRGRLKYRRTCTSADALSLVDAINFDK